MATVTYLLSTLVMGVLLLVIVGAIARSRGQRAVPERRPGEVATDRFTYYHDRLHAIASSPAVWIAVFLLLLGVVGGGAVLFVSGESVPASVRNAAGIALGAVFGLVITGYVFVGAYRAVRARGFGNAMSVAASLWVVGLLAVLGIAAKLVLGL